MLERFYNTNYKYEICIDEAGRGCLFGRVYIASVVLPKEPQLFDGTNIKDSKKFSSKKKINEVSEYIKKNALYYSVQYEESSTIDNVNILKAVMHGMHKCISDTIKHIMNNIDKNATYDDFLIVVDGNYFKPYLQFDISINELIQINHVTIEQGDAKYIGIAAASIIAKTSRDAYIHDLCEKTPLLDEYYGLKKNVGYGTKQHREGIQQHGITRMHRRTYGENCRNAEINNIL
ncbi:MAG: ribonuclease HII [Cyanobacteriota bacterium]|nr:ribonuclease HII [Cyanobacteriota bacterium]